jgi:hypothetical protein
MEGKTALGASSPAKPALHIPLPLSTTSACTSSSACSRGEEESETVLQKVWGSATMLHSACTPQNAAQTTVEYLLQQCTVKLDCAAVHRHSMQGNGCSQNKDTLCNGLAPTTPQASIKHSAQSHLRLQDAVLAAERATQKLLELSAPQNERVQTTWHALAVRGYYREAAASANDALMLRTHHDCLCVVLCCVWLVGFSVFSGWGINPFKSETPTLMNSTALSSWC